MELKTNVTILIPTRKTYCDYSIRMDTLPNDKAQGQWDMIDYMPTPLRQGYTKFNSFGDTKGDAFLDKGTVPGYKLFLFKLGRLKDPVMSMFGNGFVRIDMDVKEHMFATGKESWAKKAETIPDMKEVIAIFWK